MSDHTMSDQPSNLDTIEQAITAEEPTDAPSLPNANPQETVSSDQSSGDALDAVAIQASEVPHPELGGVGVNPYNPHHRFGCGCPSCNKKAKLARGEELATPAPKPAAPPAKRNIAPEVSKPRAVAAATARWDAVAAAKFDWYNAPLDAAQQRLGDLRREIEEGGRVLQQRFSTANNKTVPCTVCKKPIENGRWAQNRTIRNTLTGLLESAFLCGQLCIAKYNQNPGNYPPAGGNPTGLPTPEPPEFVQKAQREAKLHGKDGLLT